MKVIAAFLCIALPLTAAPPHAKFAAPGTAEVRWTGGFWGGKFELVRKVTFPLMWQSLQKPNNGASIVNFRLAAGVEKGEFRSRDWSDGDVYKWIETGAYLYALSGDREIDRLMEEAIASIAKAQASDGYIGTQIQVTGRKRWANFNHHELYNMGHLMTAASVHHRQTGKRDFLDVALRTAEYLERTFAPRPRELAHFGFNPSNIMGAVDLYRLTGDAKHLKLAETFVGMRGSAPGGTDLNQTRTPLRQETEAVGHAVAATYLYCGAADVYSETGEQALLSALVRIWDNAATRKVAVTGAVGAVSPGASPKGDHVHEAFGLDYQLPNRTGYNETCSNIGNAMWSWRMLNITGEAKYADMMETVLYNSMLSALSLDGKAFFYGNPLRHYAGEVPFQGNRHYQRWPDTTAPASPRSYCCPPSISRTIANLGTWAYSIAPGAVRVNLFGTNTLRTSEIELSQQSGYPWEGGVAIVVGKAPAGEYNVMVRVPGWAEGASLRVNGVEVPGAVPGAYAEMRRQWKSGDRIELHLPLEVRLIESNPLAEETADRAAVARGPVVYCLESTDLPPGVRFTEVVISAGIRFEVRRDQGVLGGVPVLEGQARRIKDGNWSGLLYRTMRASPAETIPVRLIPYHTWANRGVAQMTVWLPVSR